MSNGEAVKINVWQARALAEAMAAHDNPNDETLRSAYADVNAVEMPDSEHLLVVRWEDGGSLVLWHDGLDVTDEYKEVI